jgi:hypothetical protein
MNSPLWEMVLKGFFVTKSDISTLVLGIVLVFLVVLIESLFMWEASQYKWDKINKCYFVKQYIWFYHAWLQIKLNVLP